MTARIFRSGITTLTLLSLLLGGISPVFAASNQTFKVQGANITPSSPSDFGSAALYQSLKNLKADNANSVTFIIPLIQSSETSTDVGSTWSTPTDASLITAITEAHALGLAVILKPHDEVRSGIWRAYIDPTNRSEWFNNYASVLSHYAQIAQANKVEQIVLGTELIYVASATHNATNTQKWYDLIAKIRTVYSGELGYASNWGAGDYDEMDQIEFWDKLDFIGVDLYYTYASATESIPDMVNELKVWNENDLSKLQGRYNKPVEFTELGYRSVENANTQPFNWEMQGPVDLVDQANAYQAVFTYWSTIPFIRGMSLWQWNSDPNSGGTNDTDYTPQGKPAEAIISAWYGGQGSSTTITNVLQPLQATATVSASSTPSGSPITITTQVTNAGNYNQVNQIIDTEVYSPNGTKVFQQFKTGQSAAVGQTNTYTNSWTPPANGTYTVKVGAFSSDWTHSYTWNNAAATIVVQDQAGTLPSLPPVVSGMLSVVANSITSTAGSLASIIATVSNGGAALTNVLVDTEVYNEQGSKVFQYFANNQSFAQGEQKTFPSSYNPQMPGIYRIAMGIFTSDWSKNLFWSNQAGSITVQAPGAVIATTTSPVATTTPPVSTSTPPVATTTAPISTTTPPVATTTPPVATSTPPFVPPPPPVVRTGIISGSSSARLGTSVNFVGRNFGHEENVSISVNGQTLSTTPHADGGGNFSTGSISVPQTPGTYTYVFTGTTSGIVGASIVDITP